jgi:endonuclease/exonuclease/phosphatase family metal-dependent hydrolase
MNAPFGQFGVKPPPRRRPRWPRIVLLFLGLIAFTWLYGYLRFPTGSDSGVGVNGSLPATRPAAVPGVFRVATFNMHSGVGEDDVFDLDRGTASVRDTDICGLDEVDGSYFGPPTNQAQELADRTGHAWIFAPTQRRFWREDFGNAFLTRLPVENWVRIPLPTTPKRSGWRNMLILRVDFGRTTVPVIVTHIDRESDHDNQVRMVTRLFDSLQSPALLLADLNASRHNPEVRALLALPGVHDCLADGGLTTDSEGRIDWIISRGLRTLRSGQIQGNAIGERASDHPLYWADVEVLGK